MFDGSWAFTFHRVAWLDGTSLTTIDGDIDVRDRDVAVYEDLDIDVVQTG